MTLEPFRSAMAMPVGESGDTSLAVPSDINMRSAQQRVMDQVHTIARSKSRYSTKSGSGLILPTSPKSDNVFYDVLTINTSPTTHKGYLSEFKNTTMNKGSGFVNGTMNKGSVFVNGTMNGLKDPLRPTIKGSAQVNGHAKMFVDQESRRTVSSSRTVSQRTNATTSWKRHKSAPAPRLLPISPTAGYQTRIQLDGHRQVSQGSRQDSSRSVPDLTTRIGFQQRMEVAGQARQTASRFPASLSSPHMEVDGPGFLQIQKGGALSQHSMTQIRHPPSNHSLADFKISMVKGQTIDVQKMDISMSDAIQYLSSQDESYQLLGATFIQHNTFTEDKAKQQVFQMKGIPALVALLQSPNLQIQTTASAALRNLVYKHSGNKEEVQRSGGLAQVVQLLMDTPSSEIQKQLTGLLWNLSSADSLKADLLKSSLPVLTEHVVVPYTNIINLNNNMEPEIFLNATACLRNLSAAKVGNRQSMRKTSGLIDALVKYIQNCVADDKPDDKSVENCVCILHNLTYGLESECPLLFTRLNALARSPTTTQTSTPGPLSCFSTQSSKIQQEAHFDYPVMEDNNPSGSACLFHSKTLQMYRSLLGTSENPATLEACCGAMQNLTATTGTVSAVLSQTIVQKLNGLRVICPLLKSENVNLKCSAVQLLGNLSRHPQLHSSMARQALPSLTDFISAGVPNVTQDETEMDETMATACHTAYALMKAEQELSKGLLSNSLINSLNNISHNSNLPMSSKAAAFLLYNLWAEKDFQSLFKKQGMHKKAFVNDVTKAAHRSIMVID
ncbi:plakophilin-1 isoform X1 [Alosa sapidissima]|uniref:plakophilin-1 isoform X1 n=1 Tax=Alosa sapidissima TaxID=34773 RepID=UPI001C0A313D|nr:plakophilin-1 isoform X1 [Alosa sapidissima]